MPSNKMEAKVTTLKTEVTSLHNVLITIQSQVKENHEKLLTMFEQRLTMSGDGGLGVKWFHSDPIIEFRQSVKKVELPMFTGEDPARWTTRANIYFQIKETTLEIHVGLDQLCMKGSTIHFFKPLLDDEVEITWDHLKGKLLEG